MSRFRDLSGECEGAKCVRLLLLVRMLLLCGLVVTVGRFVHIKIRPETREKREVRTEQQQ